MDAGTSSLIVALMGISGTLASAVLTQRTASKGKMRELAHADRERNEERTYQARLNNLETRRIAYVALNTAARLFLTELTNYLHALRSESISDAMREKVESARLEHRTRHAEAQMILPDRVLDFAGAVNRRLGDLYGMLRRLDKEEHEAGESAASAEALRGQAWDQIFEMRRAMRTDLGISASAPSIESGDT